MLDSLSCSFTSMSFLNNINTFVFISFRKPHVIGYKIDTWLRNWNFISQWRKHPFKHTLTHFWELFSNVMETNNYTHHNSWKCGTLKQIIQISIVFNKVEMKLSEFNSFFFSVLEGCLFVCLFVCLKVFNTTFNNISVISWWSVVLMEETGGPGENHRPVASHWQTLSHNVVHFALIEIWTHNIRGNRH
jgi:hypothetical protein